jgi:hypothetical protein
LEKSEAISVAWIAAGAAVVSALIAGAFQVLHAGEDKVARPAQVQVVQEQKATVKSVMASNKVPLLDRAVEILKLRIQEGSTVTVIVRDKDGSVNESIKAHLHQQIRQNSTLIIVSDTEARAIENELFLQQVKGSSIQPNHKIGRTTDYVIVANEHSVLLYDWKTGATITSVPYFVESN